MRGFITELDFELADELFPGIVHHYEQLPVKPSTFLELFWSYTRNDCAVDRGDLRGLAFTRESRERDRRF